MWVCYAWRGIGWSGRWLACILGVLKRRCERNLSEQSLLSPWQWGIGGHARGFGLATKAWDAGASPAARLLSPWCQGVVGTTQQAMGRAAQRDASPARLSAGFLGLPPHPAHLVALKVYPQGAHAVGAGVVEHHRRMGAAVERAQAQLQVREGASVREADEGVAMTGGGTVVRCVATMEHVCAMVLGLKQLVMKQQLRQCA